jgi:hypothetical protein
MNEKEFLINALRSGGSLVVNKQLIKTFGLIPAILLSNYLEKQFYFDKKNPDNDGWFFLSHSRIREELNIKEYTLTQSKSKLLELSIIEVERRGMPAKEWIKVDFESLIKNLKAQVPKFSGGQVPKFSGGQRVIINNNTINKTKRRKLNYIVEGSKRTLTQKNKQYLPISKILMEIVQSKKNVKIDGRKLNSWNNSVRQLVELDGVEPRRIRIALRWYRYHYADNFVPVIESGQSLRDKFLKLENAIEREKNQKPENKSGFKGKQPLKYKKSIPV